MHYTSVTSNHRKEITDTLNAETKDPKAKVVNNVTPKVRRLFDLIKCYDPTQFSDEDKDNFQLRGIVICAKLSVAAVLNLMVEVSEQVLKD
jgi:hypothetical protein